MRDVDWTAISSAIGAVAFFACLAFGIKSCHDLARDCVKSGSEWVDAECRRPR